MLLRHTQQYKNKIEESAFLGSCVEEEKLYFDRGVENTNQESTALTG